MAAISYPWSNALRRTLFGSKLNVLLLLIPIALALEIMHVGGDVAVFVTAALAIMPLAGMIGHATEELSVRAGPGGRGSAGS